MGLGGMWRQRSRRWLIYRVLHRFPRVVRNTYQQYSQPIYGRRIINRRRIEEVSYNILVIIPLHRESVTLLWEKIVHEWDNEAKAIPAEIIFMAQDYPEDRPLKI